MVGSNVRMESAASTPSLVLLEQLMDSTEDGSPLKHIPVNRKRYSLPPETSTPSPDGKSRWPHNRLQNIIRSSLRGRRKPEPVLEAAESMPTIGRIWCDSEQCLSAGPFIRVQRFPKNGQCERCGRDLYDASTSTESVGDALDLIGELGNAEATDKNNDERIDSRNVGGVPGFKRPVKRNPNSDKIDHSERASRRKSLPSALDWWSDKVLKRQSSNMKENVRKSWNPEDRIESLTERISVSDISINEIGANSRTEVNRIKDDNIRSSSHDRWNGRSKTSSSKREIKHVSKSTPNLSYPSTFVDKSESARLAAWWEESPFPVRSQRFTFHSHSSGQKVVLQKGESMYEVSEKGKRRQSMNFADLEALMGAVSGSEEETEVEADERNAAHFLQPYQALAEEMDSHSGNINQSNSKALSKHSYSRSNNQRTMRRLAASEETLSRSSSTPVHSMPKSPNVLHASVSTPYLNGSVPASGDWSAMSPSLDSVIQAQFLRNASLTSLQCQKQSSSPLPGDALRTPKRLQRATRSAVKARRDQQRHSWAGNPNTLSNSVLKLVRSGGERSSWMGILDDLPVIPEDRGKERERSSGAALQDGLLDEPIFHLTKKGSLEATSALGIQEPREDPESEDRDKDSRTKDAKHYQPLKGEPSSSRNRKHKRTKQPFQRRVSPPSYCNPWVLQPQQLRQKLEDLQQQEQGGGGHPLQNGGVRHVIRPELIIVDIFDDSKEVSCSEPGGEKWKMPQESVMADPVNESVSVNNSNMDAFPEQVRDRDNETSSKSSDGSPTLLVRSVPKITHMKEVFVDPPVRRSRDPTEKTEKHARTTNNNRRSLSPHARDYVTKLSRNGAIGKRRSQALTAGAENNEDQVNGYRQRKKSLALAMNEGRLEMKEVRMRPLDIETDFHLIAQLNQLNQELMDLSKSANSTSPSSPGPKDKKSFSLLDDSQECLIDAKDKNNALLHSPTLRTSPETKHPVTLSETRHSITSSELKHSGNASDPISPLSSRKGKSPSESKHKKFNIDDLPRRRSSDEAPSPSYAKKQSPEQRVITENSKDSKSVSPREYLSRLKLRLSQTKLTRNSPQRSSAGKIEIQVLHRDADHQDIDSTEQPFRRSASLKHDSESRKTWPIGPDASKGDEDSVSGQAIYRRINSDGPVERQRKKPALLDDNTPFVRALEQSQNAPGSSTDSGLGKDHRHSKSSADSLLEDFPVSSPVSSRCNSNPPSRPTSSDLADLADLSWEKGQDLPSPQVKDMNRRYLSLSTPQSPARLTPSQGSSEDLLEHPLSMPGSHEDLLHRHGNGMRASGGSRSSHHGSSISQAALQAGGAKPPKPRHRPFKRSKTDLGDPKIIKAALALAKIQGEDSPKVLQRSRPSSGKKRPTSALGIMGMINSTSGRESPVRQLTLPEGKPSPTLERAQPMIFSEAVDVPDQGLSPRRRSQSLGSLEVITIPEMELMKRALSLPSGFSDEEEMLSDPDLSRINARMSETFDQCCAATLAEALFDHVTMDGCELKFQAGAMIEITDMTDPYWWWGCIDKQEGWLPAPFVRLKVSQGETVEECMSRLSQDQASPTSSSQRHQPSHEPLMRKVSLSFLSNDQVRAKVISEIITTERDYVKNLADICKGYIEQARSRPDMFSPALMAKLFCNIEEIFSFQQAFLADLETCITEDMPHRSAIGGCFLKYKCSFDIYGEYCNNYPHAVSELQELMKDNKYVQFFEACRLLQSMIQISLDGFLLTPVQKICKYPLQLNELLKYTRPQHPDREALKAALDAMREVAQSINERKRRIEHIENIAQWQKTIGDWEGEDVLDRSSMLIYSDEVIRVSLTGRHRTTPRQLFLFDHQLIICRKLYVDEWIDKTKKGEVHGKDFLAASFHMWRDILRRDLFVYKDRIDLDDCQIEDLPDGKENDWNVTLRYAWKIKNESEDSSKAYVFMCRSRKEKRRWMRHFAKERKIVAEGLTRGSSFMAAKEAALKATSAANKPSKPSDRVTVRRALSMPHRKVREVGREGAPQQQQQPRTPQPEGGDDPATPKRKGRSLFGFQVGKK